MKTIRTTVTQTTKIDLTSDQVEEILRAHFKAPATAIVRFEMDYGEYMRWATIEWSVMSSTDVEPVDE